MLRALRPLARRSALTAALVVRMVPLAAADLQSLREAAELRGPGAEPVGRAAMARRLVEGSLDRSIDVAATLELRGHSLGARLQPGREANGPAAPLLLAAAGVVAAGVAALALGAGGFETYPRITLELGRRDPRALRRPAAARPGPVRGPAVAPSRASRAVAPS